VTITNTDLNQLLDAIRAGGDIDVVRRGVELMLQALIDAEATAQIGADRFERTRARRLGGVRPVISDQHLGLKVAIEAVMVGSAWQRCRVHFMRTC